MRTISNISNDLTTRYVPPQSPMEFRDEAWYLKSVQKYYRRMGTGVIIYMGIVTLFVVHGTLARSESTIGEVFGPLVFAVSIFTFFWIMVHTANSLAPDFDRAYRRARWLGILAGTFAFYMLTLPAFIAVRRLSHCRMLRNKFKAKNIQIIYSDLLKIGRSGSQQGFRDAQMTVECLQSSINANP